MSPDLHGLHDGDSEWEIIAMHVADHLLPTAPLERPITVSKVTCIRTAAGHLQRAQREGIHVRHNVWPDLLRKEGCEDGRRVEILEALREDAAVARAGKGLLNEGEQGQGRSRRGGVGARHLTACMGVAMAWWPSEEKGSILRVRT